MCARYLHVSVLLNIFMIIPKLTLVCRTLMTRSLPIHTHKHIIICTHKSTQCALELSNHSSFLYSNELDSFSNSCIRAMDGSDYDVRCSVAKLLGTLLALTQKPLPPNMRGKLKLPSLDDALLILSNGFVRGASGFLKSGGPDLLKTGSASREVRVGITQVDTDTRVCVLSVCVHVCTCACVCVCVHAC